MTIEEMQELFEKYENEYLEFTRVDNPEHPRPDICVFLRLHTLVPGKSDMVSAAEHDVIYLEVDPDQLAAVATEEDIIYLRRCGLIYFDEYDSLGMYV